MDTDQRDLCTALINMTIAYLADSSGNTIMFKGTSTTTKENGRPHYGAFNPTTNHVHFDPAHFSNLGTPSSDQSYQVANTAIHEVMHVYGYPDHGDGMASMNHHGKTPLYAQWPWTILNPKNDNSCLK